MDLVIEQLEELLSVCERNGEEKSNLAKQLRKSIEVLKHES